MNAKSKPFLLLYCVITAALVFWGYPAIKERYFSKDSGNQQETAKGNQGNVPEDADTAEDSEEFEDIALDGEDGSENIEDPTDNTPAIADIYLEVSKSDCTSKCKNYSDTDDITYCKQVCGFSSTPTQPKDCASLEDLDKDYCLKDNAIIKKDPKLCNEISDENIKKICKNRIMEDAFEEDSSKIQSDSLQY